jgi:hypothetical protein
MKRVKWVGILTALSLFFGLLTGIASADVNDFVVDNFEGSYRLHNDTRGGRMTTTETIAVTFSDQNHGIVRAIPTRHHGQSLKLNVQSVLRDGRTEPYTTYQENDNTVLKIGRADQTITGEHSYTVKYEMVNNVNFYKNYDEWYWDINGDQWAQPFRRVRGEVFFPEGWSVEDLPEASCYTGTIGARESVCTISKTDQGFTFRADRSLKGFEGLTVAIPLQKGLFLPRNAGDWLRDNVWQLAGVLTGLGLGAVAFRQWWRYGKDYKGRGVIVPHFEPPKHLTPAEVGLLMDYNLDNRDLSATIIDLAVRGYIIIHDDQNKKFGIFKHHEFSLELANSNLAALKPHEKKLLEALFKPIKQGTVLKIKDINRTKMSQTVSGIRKQLKTSLKKDHGLIEETPAKPLRILWAIGIGACIILILIRPGWGWFAGMSIAVISPLIFGLLMRRRSHAGVESFEHIQGLKWYMDTAEKDRFDKMQSVERPYAEPARSVKMFEKLLPYAVALGVEKSWAKQFDNIYTEQPSWYTGSYATFNTVYVASSLTSGVSAMSTAFSQSTSSSSSGTGGGGFSGGGGGGGGGGGW